MKWDYKNVSKVNIFYLSFTFCKFDTKSILLIFLDINKVFEKYNKNKNVRIIKV